MASARLVIKDGTGAVTFDSTNIVTPLVLADFESGTSGGSMTVQISAGASPRIFQDIGDTVDGPAVASLSGNTLSWSAGASNRMRILAF